MRKIEFILMCLSATGLPAIIYHHLRSARRFGLRWVQVPPISMLDIAEQVTNSVAISYNGRPIRNLTKYQFILHNTGLRPLDKDSIIDPLVWRAPGEILSARVVNSEPRVDLSLETDNQELRISWVLFNQRCKALIEALCEGEPCFGTRQVVVGQIRNVPAIDHREVDWVGELEISPRLIAQMEARKVAHSRSRIRVLATRGFGWLLTCVLITPLIAVIWEFFSNLLSTPQAVLLMMFLVALFLSYMWNLRKPYGRFLERVAVKSNSV